MKYIFPLFFLLFFTFPLASQNLVWNSVNKHYDLVEPVAFSNDGTKVVFRTKEIDKEVKLQMFDVRTGNVIWSLDENAKAEFSEDDEKLIVYNTENIRVFNYKLDRADIDIDVPGVFSQFRFSDDYGRLYLLYLENLRIVEMGTQNKEIILDKELMPDSVFYSINLDIAHGSVVVVTSKEILKKINIEKGYVEKEKYLNDYNSNGGLLTPDGNRFLYNNYSYYVRMYDIENDTFSNINSKIEIKNLYVSNDSNILILDGYSGYSYYDLNSGKYLKSIQKPYSGHEEILPSFDTTSIAFKQYVSLSCREEIPTQGFFAAVYNDSIGQVTFTDPGFAYTKTKFVDFSVDDDLIAVSGNASSLNIFERKTGKKKIVIPELGESIFTFDNKYLFISPDNKTIAKQYNAETGEFIQSYDYDCGFIYDMLMSPDGKYFLVIGNKKIGFVSTTDYELKQIFTFGNSLFLVDAVHISNDGQYFSAMLSEGIIKVWRASDYELISEINIIDFVDDLTSLNDFTTDGRYIANQKNDTLFVYDTDDGSVVVSTDLSEELVDYYKNLKFVGNGKHVLVHYSKIEFGGILEDIILFVNYHTGEIDGSISTNGHVNTISLSLDGQYLTAGECNGAFSLYDLSSITSVDKQTYNDNNIIVSPQPAGDFINVKYPGSPGWKIILKIYDFSGCQVGSYSAFSGFPEKQSIKYKTRDLSPGLYFCTLQSGSKIYTQKFIKN